MVVRFGKAVDWTSMNTAIGRIGLDGENLAGSCGVLSKCFRTVFAHSIFLGSKISLQTFSFD
jgi:hypothetical protein